MVKEDPWPGSLFTWISPPSRRVISRLMERPRPVPPYLRLVVPSACWKASKMIFCLLRGMPMPVSIAEKAITPPARWSASLSSPRRSCTAWMRSCTLPCSVNLQALWIGAHVGRQRAVQLDGELEVFLLRHRAEVAVDELLEIDQRDVARLD